MKIFLLASLARSVLQIPDSIDRKLDDQVQKDAFKKDFPEATIALYRRRKRLLPRGPVVS